MTGQDKGDLLIEVTAWAGLTVIVHFDLVFKFFQTNLLWYHMERVSVSTHLHVYIYLYLANIFILQEISLFLLLFIFLSCTQILFNT